MRMRELVVACAIMGALLTAACRGTPSAPAVTSPPAAIAISTAVGTPTPSPLTFDQEVERAYLAYWEAYSDALLKLDASRAAGVASGAELQRIEEEVAQLRAQQAAVRVVVDHDFSVMRLGETHAAVVDRFRDRSFYVVPETLLPNEGSGPGQIVTDTFRLESHNGVWMVVSSTRQR